MEKWLEKLVATNNDDCFFFFTLRYVGNQERQRRRTLHQNLLGYEGFSTAVVYSKARAFLKVVHPKRQLCHSYDPHIFELHLLTSKPENCTRH